MPKNINKACTYPLNQSLFSILQNKLEYAKINFAATNHNPNIAKVVMASTLNTTSTAAQTLPKSTVSIAAYSTAVRDISIDFVIDRNLISYCSNGVQICFHIIRYGFAYNIIFLEVM